MPKTVLTEKIVTKSVTLTLDTAQYASGDVLADTQTITTAFDESGGVCELVSVVVVDKDDQKQGLELVFLNAANSLGTENGTPDITDAEAETVLAIVPIASTDYEDLGGVSIVNLPRSSLGYVMRAAATTSLYMGAISKGTGTYTASGIVVILSLAQRAL